MKKLFFILRHGERADEAHSNRTYSYHCDPCLTERGLLQAEYSAQIIYDMIKNKGNIHLASSPFLRCVETASKISQKLNIPVHIEEGFSELLEGYLFSNLSYEELEVRKNKSNLEQELGIQIIENNHIVRPKYPERWPDSKFRVRNVWDEYLRKNNSAEVIIVVTHLFLVDKIYEYWIQEDRRDPDKGYCKLGIAEFEDNYRIIEQPNSTYVFQ